MQLVALIVAGGIGSRMGSDMPKQFLLLKGKPVLMHTLAKFYDYGCSLVLVLPEAQIDFWKKLCAEHRFIVPHEIVAGGQTRFQSVKNGLTKVEANSLVAIHDGVRPCIDHATIRRTMEAAQKHGNAVAAVKLKDSIRQHADEDNHQVDRSQFSLVQTPQTFKAELIQRAYLQPEDLHFTDDAGVLEKMGMAIHLVEGNYKNIKITTPEDMLIAEVLLGL